jgi:hypothetical protein
MQEAEQLVGDDPDLRRALRIVAEAAQAERQERQGELLGVIQASGRALQHVQMQQQVPQMIQQAATQYGVQFGPDAVSFLQQLQPHQIPEAARLLGIPQQQLRQAQQHQQQQQRQQDRQHMQQSGAYRGSGVPNAPSAQEPEDGSREQLLQAMSLLGLT